MFGMLEKLTKAAIAVAVTPVAVVIDVVTLPASAEPGREPFERTGNLLKSAGDNILKAVNSDT